MGEDPSAKIERLLRKAAEDPQFKELLLAERSRAAQRIGVVLDVPEARCSIPSWRSNWRQ